MGTFIEERCCGWKRRLLLGNCVVDRSGDFYWRAVLSVEGDAFVEEMCPG